MEISMPASATLLYHLILNSLPPDHYPMHDETVDDSLFAGSTQQPDNGKPLGLFIALAAVVHAGLLSVQMHHPRPSAEIVVSVVLTQKAAAAQSAPTGATPVQASPAERHSEPEQKPEKKAVVKPKQKPEHRPVPKTISRIKPVSPPPRKSKPVEAINPVTKPVPVLEPQKTSSVEPTSHSATAPATSTMTPSQGDNTSHLDDSEATNNYLAAIRAGIEASKHYPRRARRARQQGETLVSFTIDRGGRISGLKIVRGSGYSSLDRASLDAVHAIDGRFPIPDTIQRSNWPFTVPIRYTLR